MNQYSDEMRRIYVSRKKRRRTNWVIEGILNDLGNENLNSQIDDDITIFIETLGDLRKATLKKYFLVYLQHLSIMYGEGISSKNLCELFDINSRGWLKVKTKLVGLGLIKGRHNHLSFVGPAENILEEMRVTKVISKILYQQAKYTVNHLDYPGLVGSNLPIALAFISIYTTGSIPLNEISNLFDLKDQRLEKEGRGKRWYHQLFMRTIRRLDLLPSLPF